MLDNKNMLSNDVIEKVVGAGEFEEEEHVMLRIDIYRKEQYATSLLYHGLLSDHVQTPGEILRRDVWICTEADPSTIHVYLPDGREINYAVTFPENGIIEGMTLRAVIVG